MTECMPSPPLYCQMHDQHTKKKKMAEGEFASLKQRRYDICAPLCAFHVIKIVLNVQIYMGAWAWNVKIMT